MCSRKPSYWLCGDRLPNSTQIPGESLARSVLHLKLPFSALSTAKHFPSPTQLCVFMSSVVVRTFLEGCREREVQLLTFVLCRSIVMRPAQPSTFWSDCPCSGRATGWKAGEGWRMLFSAGIFSPSSFVQCSPCAQKFSHSLMSSWLVHWGHHAEFLPVAAFPDLPLSLTLLFPLVLLKINTGRIQGNCCFSVKKSEITSCSVWDSTS